MASKIFLTKNNLPVQEILGAKVADVENLLADRTDESDDG